MNVFARACPPLRVSAAAMFAAMLAVVCVSAATMATAATGATAIAQSQGAASVAPPAAGASAGAILAGATSSPAPGATAAPNAVTPANTATGAAANSSQPIKDDPDDKWDLKNKLAAGAAILALCTLAFNTYTRWRNANQSFYAHLSKIWYDLRKVETDKPKWMDPEFTSFYGLRDEIRPAGGYSGYDAHAWATWALAEDWYETYGRGKNFTGEVQERRFFHNELAQFQGSLHGVTELHWAWLMVPRNLCRFDPGFVQWVRENFLEFRFKTTTTGVIHGTGVLAARKIDAGQFIGFMEGHVVNARSDHTLQLTDDLHLAVVNGMRYLNHSHSPNAVIRGRVVFAIKEIAKDSEITINYSCTEDAFEIEGRQLGYDYLIDSEKKVLYPLLHRRIRERSARIAGASTEKLALGAWIRSPSDVQGFIEKPITAAYVRDGLNAAGIPATEVRFLTPSDRLVVFGTHHVEASVNGKPLHLALQVDSD